MPRPPGATCPWIDDLAKLVRRHMKGTENREDRKQALTLCENLRGANYQLRLCYTEEIERRREAEKELAALRRRFPD